MCRRTRRGGRDRHPPRRVDAACSPAFRNPSPKLLADGKIQPGRRVFRPRPPPRVRETHCRNCTAAPRGLCQICDLGRGQAEIGRHPNRTQHPRREHGLEHGVGVARRAENPIAMLHAAFRQCAGGSLDTRGELRPCPGLVAPDKRRPVGKPPRRLRTAVREVRCVGISARGLQNRHVVATAAPPMLNTPARSALGNCMPPASPISCFAVITCMDTPVAPSGWPFALRPPDGSTGSRPSFAVHPSSTARAPWPGAVSPIASYSISSAIVKQSCELDERRDQPLSHPDASNARPRLARAVELRDVAPPDRQEVIGLHPARNRTRHAHGLRRLLVRHGPWRQPRLIPGSNRIASVAAQHTDCARYRIAEVEAQILAHMRVRVVHAVLWFFAAIIANLGFVAVALEIALRDAAEHAREACGNVGFLLLVAGTSAGCRRPPCPASPSSSRRRSPARTDPAQRRGSHARHALRPTPRRRHSRNA